MPRPVSMLSITLLLAAGVRAEPPVEPQSLVPLDQGIADVGSLNASLRVPRSDLRVATDFERVYEAPGNPNMLVRVDGALYATFPRSEYITTERGRMPVVPAGTTWSIGEASLGCAEPYKPACSQPAQQPFLMPALAAPATPSCAPPPAGSVALIAMPRAQPVGRLLVAQRDARLTTALPPVSAIELESADDDAPVARAAPRMPTTFDLCDPFYRRARLRAISLRYAPTRD